MVILWFTAVDFKAVAYGVVKEEAPVPGGGMLEAGSGEGEANGG